MTVIDTSRHPLATGCPPAWAVAWGQDGYWVWVEFEVPSENGDAVCQRLRWVPPGQFLMGLSEDEPGRYGVDELRGIYNEGPQHLVTMTQGVWLFDTPCTQALWQAVMGDNPSRFQSPMRPVEGVLWDRTQEFLAKINRLIPDLDLTLPTEAQWEHACRAGTDTATYAGRLIILGARNAPALGDIAWYGGNSGVNFELERGHDVSSWPEKQYGGILAGTHPVGQKDPNTWGLHDMLGNVWEWCLDARRAYDAEAVTDPVGPASNDTDTGRVLRGGSWFSIARHVRCSFRLPYNPDRRPDTIGFRCARVQ